MEQSWHNIISMASYTVFKNALLSFIRPKHVDTFGIRLGTNLNEHKFRHNFRDFLNPLRECKLEPETTSYFLPRCHLFQVERTTLLNDIQEIDERIKSDNKSILDQILLYGNENYNHDIQKKILLSTINFCIDSIKDLICPCYRLFLCKIKRVPLSKTFS